MNLGISGKLTRATIMSPLTPLFLLAAILVGLLATITIPREEEPQIKVPMVDIMVQAPGLSAREAVELVGKPLETIVKSVDGVEHVYTQAQDNGALVTARFLVGSNPEDAAIRINEKIEANKDRIPVGIPAPQVTVRGINDVPIVVLTLTPKPGAAGAWNDQALAELALTQLKEVLDVYASRSVDTIGFVRDCDEQIDAMYTSLFRELLTYMMEDPRNITACTHLLFCAKNIERIGDHATNIAETVFYIVTGKQMPPDRPKEDKSHNVGLTKASER